MVVSLQSVNDCEVSNLVQYYLNGVGLQTMGIFVSRSSGLIDRQAVKEVPTVDWPDLHGLVRGHRKERFLPREIRLYCFMKADSRGSLVKALQQFLFVSEGLNQLRLVVEDSISPLVYMVTQEEAVEVNKTWQEGQMVATFELHLIEPEPVKRLLLYLPSADPCLISLQSESPLTIYWGDGEVSYDVMSQGMPLPDRVYDGMTVKVLHHYQTGITALQAYFVLAGDVDAIQSFDTNAQLLWSRY